MKILLINPSQTGVYGKMSPPDYPPMGLAYIGAVLERKGHQVRILDISADKLSKENLIKFFKNSDIVGLTATTPTFRNAEAICKLAKENSSAKIILGGIHATIASEECAKSKFIDFVVRGEGEETIAELVDAIENKKSMKKINGISFKMKNKIISTPNRDLIKDLDSLPFPARHLFNHQKYSYPDSLASPVMPIMTSRGCPHGCTYCCTKQIFTRRVRFRSAKNVIEEIEFLIKKYGVKEIHFWDDNFTLNKQRVFEIRDEIKRRGIKLNFAFPNGLRVDQVDEDILRALRDMGVYSMAFGVESGNQTILNNVQKGTTIAQIEKAYHIAKKLGFETWGFFMLGLPGETEDTIKDTINFAKKINPDIAKFHILKPFPGTEVFNQFKEAGLITNFDYFNYGIHTRPVHRLPGLSEDDLLKWSKIAYKQFYLRPSKIFSQILRLKSFERVKMNAKTALALIQSMF